MNASVQASRKLNLFAEAVFVMGKDSFSPFDLPSPDIPETSPISPDNPNSKGDYDYSGIGAYSDLDYSQLEGTLGANIALDEQTSLYGSITVMDLQDDQPYVYGDMTGTLYMYAAGVTVGF